MFRTSLEYLTAWTDQPEGVAAGGRENLPGFCVELGRDQKFVVLLFMTAFPVCLPVRILSVLCPSLVRALSLRKCLKR